MPEIKPSNEPRTKNENPLFPIKLVEAIRKLTGACNQSLLMKIAAKEFVEENTIEEIAQIVKDNKDPIRMAQLEKELAILKARQKGKA